MATVFSDPLVPIGSPAAPLEDVALSRAITTYLRTGTSEDVAPFVTFLAEHRDSPWRASLMANLGGVYRRHGYLSRALIAWDEAWQLAKTHPEPLSHAVADGAVADWLELSINLARIDAATQRMAELATREVGGTASTRSEEHTSELQSQR